MPTLSNGRPAFGYILESPRDYAGWSAFRRDVQAVAAAGYDGVEVQMRSPDDLAGQDFRALLGDCGLRLAGIQTGFAYRDRGLCLASPEAPVRRRTEDLLLRYLEFAAAFGAIVVFGLLQGTSGDEPDRERAVERIHLHLGRVAAFARQSGAVIAVEPVNRYESAVFHNTVSEVLALVESIGSPAVRAMVDTFHVNIEEPSQREAIRAAARQLAHVHLSETNRGLFGTGHLDFGEVLTALREVAYPGFVSVGVYRRNPTLAERARHSIRHLESAYDAAHA